jgi:two-component system OmpR family sensor kinase/two-component system sensor histidine kinase BaeS
MVHAAVQLPHEQKLSMKPASSIRPIQVRLFILLLRGFSTAVLLTLLFIFVTAAILLGYSSQEGMMDRLPFVTRLETFYTVNGSWDGIDMLLPYLPQDDDEGLWQRSILLDETGKVLIFEGSAIGPMIGGPYASQPNDTRIPIQVKGREVGAFIITGSLYPTIGAIVLGLLSPVFFISIFLAALTIIIGLLLMRRFVTPLSEVIAAARALAAGDLSTRIQVSGPDDLRVLSDSFNHMADALERSDLERRNMLADIAHELRTPLTVIRGRLEGIVDGVYPADEGHVVPALEETYLLERLVDDLRLLTLAETRQLPFEQRAVDLNDLARRVIDLFRAESEEKGIRISLEADSAPVNIHLDPQRAEQVVSNLVANALRYTPEGGDVWITVKQETAGVFLCVSDNGPGVPAEDIPHLFDRFWRGEKSRSRASGGAGLGLAIAKQLVEAQNGSISARNREGGGLEMTIAFQPRPEG